MTDNQAKQQRATLDRYETLSALRKKFQRVIDMVTASDPNGPCEQGPFTGNTRESREVEGMVMSFSKTKGGSEKVVMEIDGLNINAFEFGKFLCSQARAKLMSIEAEISQL